MWFTFYGSASTAFSLARFSLQTKTTRNNCALSPITLYIPISNNADKFILILRRNNEKRKEKSRDAARCRRSRETEIFTDLGETLPVSKDELENLDKASVMRLAIATFKIEDMLKSCK